MKAKTLILFRCGSCNNFVCFDADALICRGDAVVVCNICRGDAVVVCNECQDVFKVTPEDIVGTSKYNDDSENGEENNDYSQKIKKAS